MKVAILFLALIVSAYACPHDGYSTDIADLSATCETTDGQECQSANDCEHGQQCCFEIGGCTSICYHPDPIHTIPIHTTHPAP